MVGGRIQIKFTKIDKLQSITKYVDEIACISNSTCRNKILVKAVTLNCRKDIKLKDHIHSLVSEIIKQQNNDNISKHITFSLKNGGNAVIIKMNKEEESFELEIDNENLPPYTDTEMYISYFAIQFIRMLTLQETSGLLTNSKQQTNSIISDIKRVIQQIKKQKYDFAEINDKLLEFISDLISKYYGDQWKKTLSDICENGNVNTLLKDKLGLSVGRKIPKVSLNIITDFLVSKLILSLTESHDDVKQIEIKKNIYSKKDVINPSTAAPTASTAPT